jgi:outer membrane protein TolC
LPSLALEGSGSTQGNSLTSGLQSEAEVGVNVQWTLFDGGILAAKATTQRKQQEQSLQQAALDRLMVISEVETNYAAYLSSQIVVDAAAAQMQHAQDAIAAATKGYQAGTSDATTLLQVLANTRGAVEAYTRSLQKHNKSVAALYRHSARWPELAPALLEQRLNHLNAHPEQGPAVKSPN